MFETIKDNAEKISKSYAAVIEEIYDIDIDNVKVLTPKSIVTNNDLSLNMLTTNIEMACNIVQALPKDPAQHLSPYDLIEQLNVKIQAIQGNIDIINASIEFIKNNIGSFKFNKSDLVFVNINNQGNKSFKVEFSEIEEHVDNLTTPLLILTMAYGSKKPQSIEIDHTVVLKLMETTISAKEAASKAKAVTKRHATNSENDAHKSKEKSEQAVECADIANDKMQAIIELETSANLNENQIREILNEATNLKNQVEGYQEKFTSLQDNIDGYNSAHDKASLSVNAFLETNNNQLKKLVAKAIEITKRNEKLTDESLKLLGLATSAGLSNSYGKARNDIEGPATKARWAFYISIFLLFVSVLLAFDAVPMVKDYIKFPETLTNGDGLKNVWSIIGVSSMRVLALLPALMLVGFTSRRHKQLFEIAEEYRHKETIAASVASFKEQAGKQYEGVIAAAAFDALIPSPVIGRDETSNIKKITIPAQHLQTEIREDLEEMAKKKLDE